VNRCFSEILGQSVLPTQIILIDDCSELPAEASLSSLLLSELEIKHGVEFLLLRNSKNLGLAGSYNRALQECKYEIVMVMHPDVVLPSEHEVSRLMEPLQDENTCIVGHRSVPISEEYWSVLNISGKLFVGSSQSRRAHGFNGQFDAFRKSVALQESGFDSKKFRTAGEDGDFLSRMARKGAYVLSAAQAEHHHDFRGSMSLMGLLRKSAQYGNAQGALLFKGAHLSSAYREILAIFLVVSIFFRSYFFFLFLVLICLSGVRIPALIFRRDRDLNRFFQAYLIELIRFWAHVYGYIHALFSGKQRF
jgi:GT2 family glycosyltransferase